MEKITCPHCAKPFYINDRREPNWRMRLPELLSSMCDSTSPTATADLVHTGQSLAMWKAYSSGHRRLRELEGEGYLTQLSHGWWGILGKGIDYLRAGKYPLGIHAVFPGEVKRWEDMPAEGEDPIPVELPSRKSPMLLSETVPPPSPEHLTFLADFATWAPAMRHGFKSLVRVAKQFGHFNVRNCRGQIRSLIANGYLKYAADRYTLELTPAARARLEATPPTRDAIPRPTGLEFGNQPRRE